MIIDAITDIKNIITVSPNHSRLSHKVDKTTYSLFSDFSESFVFEITEPDNPLQPNNNFAWVQVDFTETILLSDLIYSLTASTTPFVKCLYSFELDGLTWNEFPFFSYNLTGYQSLSDSATKIALKTYEGVIFKKIHNNTQRITAKDNRGVVTDVFPPMHNYIYIAYNPLAKATIDVPLADYQLIAPILDDMFDNFNTDTATFKYEFHVVNQTTNEITYIYDNLYVRQIKLEFYKYLTNPVPFSLDSLRVLTPITVDIEKNIISCFNDIMFKPKYFESNPFIPELTKTFLEMLEFSDKNVSEKIPTLEIDFAIDNLSYKVFLYSNTEINISRVFNPLYIWTINATNRDGIQSFARYTYTTVDNRWDNVDAFINNMITDTNYVKLEVTFAIVNTKFILSKRRVYDLTKYYFGDGWISSLGIGDMEIDKTFFVY